MHQVFVAAYMAVYIHPHTAECMLAFSSLITSKSRILIYSTNVCPVSPGHDFVFCTIPFPLMTISPAFNVIHCS